MAAEYEDLREATLAQTQGLVDLSVFHPNLGRYFTRPLFDDIPFWTEAQGRFAPTEATEFNLGKNFKDHFKPDILMFGDDSAASRVILSRLLDSEFYTRVFPTDQHFPEPSIGEVLLDFIATGEPASIKLIGELTVLNQGIAAIVNRMSGPNPSENWPQVRQKIKQIKRDRTVKDYAELIGKTAEEVKSFLG